MGKNRRFFPTFAKMVVVNPVSSKLVAARLIALMPCFVVAFVGFAISAYVWSPWLWAGGVVTLVAALWVAWLIPLQVRNLGWEERDDELLITKGKMWRTLTVVPYGRIQFVDVTEGPIASRFGLARVELHTASSTSDSAIPGLEVDQAHELRRRLSEKARERMSGL
ncbi:hypothetical protein EU799_11775 [Corynebacterium silvaticum]|uniref:PH domain-containing protein n=2 Tax=Corynebacterium silvaticum TaxID=2320431 RepID=A0A7U5HKQ5_9CORY|nr:PH domain-containing protein [Corynebacterium silvaticum]ARU45587.1 PH domain-containing protein [Corynebacterium silvaticum]TFA92004.1 hypothetical protein EU799_11775 [Corynebacterium silvaticum]TFA92019.1 hypothetical protein EU802_07250 [Corynebacterium silvaticum]TNX79247.1 hypothetical protein FIT55_10200 [Corynebacterium silvaticum]TRM16674.1 PH domain-containing protein [Corynebacterium silvaticum]